MFFLPERIDSVVNHAAESGLDGINLIGKDGAGGLVLDPVVVQQHQQQLASPNGSLPSPSSFPVEQLNLLKGAGAQSSLVNGVVGGGVGGVGGGLGVPLNCASGPLTCEQCGLSFTQREELEKHEASHPTPNQVCTLYTAFKHHFCTTHPFSIQSILR